MNNRSQGTAQQFKYRIINFKYSEYTTKVVLYDIFKIPNFDRFKNIHCIRSKFRNFLLTLTKLSQCNDLKIL